MRTLIYLLLLVAVVVVAALAVNVFGAEAGYVLLSYRDHTVEMTLWTLMGLTILGLLLLWLLLQLVMMLFGVPSSLGGWRNNRRKKAAVRLTNQGQMAYVEGNWQGAQQALGQAGQKNDAPQPLINYVLAARANEALGDMQGAKLALLEGQKQVPKSALALGITEAELQARRGHWDQAQQSLLRAGANSGSHPAALKLMAELYEQKQEWSELHKLLPKLNKAGVLDSAEALALERRVFSALLDQAAGDKHALDSTWKQVPADLKNDPTIASAYAHRLIDQGDPVSAEKFLRQAASANLPDELVNLYGQVRGGDLREQLDTVEGWLRENGHSSELYLCAGRVALGNRKWAEARDYLERCLKRDQNPEAFAELGRLLSNLGEREAGADCYRQGLIAACGGLPNLPSPTPPPPAPVSETMSTEAPVTSSSARESVSPDSAADD